MSPELDCPPQGRQRLCSAVGIPTVRIKFQDVRQYLPEVIANKEFQKLFLKFLKGRIQREEQIVQVPRDWLLKAGLSEGVT